MNIETSLNYVTLHSQSIIQWLCLVIVLLVGTLIAIALFGRREASADGIAVGGDLSEQLNRLIEASGRAGAGTIGSADAAPGDDGRVEKLEGEIKVRDDEIVKLRDEVTKAAAAGVVDPALGARLKELEAKLAEYEILEDDIADLSLYKEENSRLKSELEALKAEGGGSEPSPAPNGVVGSAEAQPQRTAEAAAQAAAAAAAFDEPVAPAAPAAAEPAVAEPAVAEPAAKTPSEGADDLFAEFATALEDGGIPTSEANRRAE